MFIDIPDELKALSDNLVALSICRGLLPGRPITTPKFTFQTNDYIRLLNEASVLAFSTDAKARMLAYEIATHSLAIKKAESPGLIHTADFILTRLANFPGRTLLRKNYRASLQKHPGMGVPLLLESLVRERDNTVDGFAYALTDFQMEFFLALKNTRAVSISAPTSAGKSFVLSQHIVRLLRSKANSCVIYLVPTRALIREVMLRLRKELSKGGLKGVAQRCVPLQHNADDFPGGIVYVLTQERLLSLMHASKELFKMDLLIVDEAQGIRDGARGVLLQTSIEQATTKCPLAEVVFASPLIRNPKYFLDLFSHPAGHASVERHSPVGQNFILVEPDISTEDVLDFSLLRHGEKISLGSRTCVHNLRKAGMVRQRVELALSVTGPSESCLVYANGCDDAESLASCFDRLITEAETVKEIDEFISYIEEHIHPDYPLIGPLRKKVAFHHGDMPASVRGGVEDLFRSKKLRFICCTSTLLQGVNLPAKHLVVDRPRRGNTHPLEPADFLNLAGRAGRLGREFHGNVWCINPRKWPKPPQDQTSLPEIAASFEVTTRDNAAKINEILSDSNPLQDRDGLVTASIGRLLTEYVFLGKSPIFPEDEVKSAELGMAMDRLKSLKLRLPKEVFIRNSTVLPQRLEQLFLVLMSKDSLGDWIPPAPYHDGFYETLQRIFELLQNEIEGKPGIGYRFDTNLACKWIRQWTLRRIIEATLAWKIKHNQDAKPKEVIRKLVRSIEQRMRFELVRNLRAYHDVLQFVLVSKGRSAEADNLRPLHLYVECGGHKLSLLSLMSLGFSRTTSLILLEAMRLPDDLTPENCRTRILRTNLTRLKIPDLVRREILQLLGTS